ncbi:sulfotransferase [Mycobacterium sp. RTGN5]|uniref:sulfotransferase family protein n=1 Tax=Mycobacterium sp. RTGN5 TaxID=3016522 RepID=UPI0029C8FC10|nr:sulfotransferase [Mycobacterium sp. RTGN5]
MTWTAPVRSSVAQQVYAAAEKDRAEHPERYQFDADAVIRRATKHGATTGDFADGWRDGLDVFLRSAEEDGRLNAVGVRMALQAAAGRLTAGAQIAQCFRDNPELRATPPARPIVIVGGWRTGTTFLFRLLSRDPRLHAPLPVELVAPWLSQPDPETTSTASQLLHTLNPDMAFVHPSGPSLPEECVLAMGTDLRNWGFTSMMRLPSYARWLADQDFAGPYARYREVLQLIASRDPRRLVLKAPAHTAELDHLVEAFPGAVVVQIHRDIVETLTSGATLFSVYRTTYSDDVDAKDVGRQQVDQSELWFRRAAAFRASPANDPVTFVDLDYPTLIDQTVACLEKIYAAADMEPIQRPDQFVAAYHAEHPRAAHSYQRCTPEDFGLDPGELRERFS